MFYTEGLSLFLLVIIHALYRRSIFYNVHRSYSGSLQIHTNAHTTVFKLFNNDKYYHNNHNNDTLELELDLGF